MKTLDVTIASTYPLLGTLTLPATGAGKHPAVLFLHGSGPIDRNSDAKGMPLGVFKLLAEQFGKNGFASLRYDKRGIGASGGDYHATGMYDLVDDAVEAVRFLKTQPDIDPDRIFLVGHSEGAILAPQVFEREPVAGLVLLAGIAESLRTTVDRQNEVAFKELGEMTGLKGLLIRLLRVVPLARKSNQKMFAKILASTADTIRLKGAKVNAKWFREHYQYDVRDTLAKVTCPTIAITGSKDIQVLPEQAQQIAEATAGPSEWHIIEDLTHILRKEPGRATLLSLKTSYKRLSQLPIDAELTELVLTWLRKQAAADQPTA